MFTAVADALSWALACEQVTNTIHYLDDFLFWSERDSPACAHALRVAVNLFDSLGLPIVPDKTMGPASCLTFLGIEFDTVAQELRLPREKLTRLKSTLRHWSASTNPTKRQLQSLIGILKHAASVVRPGHLFCRHIIENMKKPRALEQRTRLTHGAKSDIAWWLLFAEEWNGVSFLPGSIRLSPQSPCVVSDASGSWGCGAYLAGLGSWFQLPWPHDWSESSITVKELLPVVVAAAVWGREWSRKVVVFRCDNMAVVQILNAMAARDLRLTHLLSVLCFIEAHFQFEHRARHVAGRDNTAADALSRDNADAFFAIFPQAPRAPVQPPPSLLELLLSHELSWTSPRWKSLLRSSLQVV